MRYVCLRNCPWSPTDDRDSNGDPIVTKEGVTVSHVHLYLKGEEVEFDNDPCAVPHHFECLDEDVQAEREAYFKKAKLAKEAGAHEDSIARVESSEAVQIARRIAKETSDATLKTLISAGVVAKSAAAPAPDKESEKQDPNPTKEVTEKAPKPRPSTAKK